MMDTLIQNYSYVIVVLLMMMGLWAMIAKKNMVKKCIGMAIFQTGIILFYISMGAKKGASIPIIDYASHGYGKTQHIIDATQYANPLTQILMLTAIVVGVGTLGVALTLIQRVYENYGSLNEDEVLEKIKND